MCIGKPRYGAMLCIAVLSVLPGSTVLPDPAKAAQLTNAEGGYTLTYPDSWQTETDGQSVDLFSFPLGRAAQGGAIPAGGADIVVQAFPPYDNPFFELERSDDDNLAALAGRYPLTARTPAVSGQSARATSVDTLVNHRETFQVLHISGKVFLLILTCNADDPNAPAYDQLLDTVSASVSLVSVTPPPTTSTELNGIQFTNASGLVPRPHLVVLMCPPKPTPTS